MNFTKKRRIPTFYCLNFDSHMHLWLPVTTDIQYLRPGGTCDSLPGVFKPRNLWKVYNLFLLPSDHFWLVTWNNNFLLFEL